MGNTRTIKTAISTILSDVVGVGFNIRKLYGYFEPSPAEFPCVMVYMRNANETRLDFGSNQTNVEYSIKLIVPLEQRANSEAMEDLRLDCMDDVLDRLRKKDAVETLGGVVFKTEIIAGEPYMDNGANFPVLVTDLVLRTSRCENIST